MTDKHPQDALRLADRLRSDLPRIFRVDAEKAGAELRRLHAENEALRLALDALANQLDDIDVVDMPAHQQPVAWIYDTALPNGEVITDWTSIEHPSIVTLQDEGVHNIRPLYAAPQLANQKPLTDKQLEVVICEHTKLNPNQADDSELIGYIINAIRAIEAAHGIKEKNT